MSCLNQFDWLLVILIKINFILLLKIENLIRAKFDIYIKLYYLLFISPKYLGISNQYGIKFIALLKIF